MLAAGGSAWSAMRTRRIRRTGAGGSKGRTLTPGRMPSRARVGARATPTGGDHGLSLLVVVGLVGDLGFEAGGAATAVEGLGHGVVLGSRDPRVVRQVGERGRVAPGERVLVADEEGRRVVEEWRDDDVLAVDAAPVVVPHQGEFDLPILQHRPQAGDAGAAHREPYVGMRRPEGDDGPEAVRRRRWERCRYAGCPRAGRPSRPARSPRPSVRVRSGPPGRPGRAPRRSA